MGNHDLELPDAPHSGGGYYLDKSKYTRTWFLTGHKLLGKGNGRYLHTGSISAGCITVDPDKWDELYKHLILSRKKRDHRSIGKIKVIKSKDK